MKRCLILIAFLSLMAVSSLALAEDVTINPKTGIENVIKISRECAVKEGLELNRYFICSVQYDVSKKTWNVFFQNHIPAPGHHFMVVLEDETGKVSLIHGK